MSSAHKSEIRDGMQIGWDVPIGMDDGLVLRADLFRPLGAGRHPAIFTYGPYAKGLAFQEGYPSAWQRMVSEHPALVFGGKSTLHLGPRHPSYILLPIIPKSDS